MTSHENILCCRGNNSKSRQFRLRSSYCITCHRHPIPASRLQPHLSPDRRIADQGAPQTPLHQPRRGNQSMGHRVFSENPNFPREREICSPRCRTSCAVSLMCDDDSQVSARLSQCCHYRSFVLVCSLFGLNCLQSTEMIKLVRQMVQRIFFRKFKDDGRKPIAYRFCV